MKKYRFRGVLSGPQDMPYNYLLNTTDTIEAFSELLRSLGSDRDPREFLAVNVPFPEYEEWPPLTGRLLRDQYFRTLAETLTERTETRYVPKNLTDIDADALEALLSALTTDISVEDATPADPYCIPLPEKIKELLENRGFGLCDFFEKDPTRSAAN